jgi:hypothetical protein
MASAIALTVAGTHAAKSLKSMLESDAPMSDFSFSPSVLPWWGWLVCSAVAWFLGLLIYGNAGEKEGCLEIGFIYGFFGIGLLSFGIALIRFVKWVWAG